MKKIEHYDVATITTVSIVVFTRIFVAAKRNFLSALSKLCRGDCYRHSGQLSEELEYRIAKIETSLSKFSMVLDSVQPEAIQTNKGTKKLSLEVEGICQKLNVQDDFLHVLNRGQEDIRTSLNVGFKSISDQLSKLTQLEQILFEVYSLPERIGTNVQKWNNEVSECLSGDLQA